LADLDGDGHPDLITGSYDGGSYLLRGSKRGFRKPEPVLDADGDPLRVGAYWDYGEKKWRMVGDHGISATPVDWDEDGDLDLLLGTQDGTIYLSRNVGTKKKPSFQKVGKPLAADGRVLDVDSGHSMPVVADWDGDGKLDLITGSASGAVYWYRDVGEGGARRLAQAAQLVPPASGEWDEPGERTQVAVADWDGDGRLDLLVGDFRSRARPDDATKREYHGYVWLYRRLATGARGNR
jgi:hypothetical protein